MNTTQLATGLSILGGAVNTGVLESQGHTLLFDCCDSVTPERLADLGVAMPEMIFCTQHRRPNTAGAHAFPDARVFVPESERELVADPLGYWEDPKNRWHLYHHQPGPLTPAYPLGIAGGIGGGAVIKWHGFTIRVIDTPGATDGSVSYIVRVDDCAFCFCGDAIYGPGQMWDFSSLQKAHGRIGDYHGFLGNWVKLEHSLRAVLDAKPGILVPSHGVVMNDPEHAISTLLERMDIVWRNYTSISCLNYYFPDLFKPWENDPWRMIPVETKRQPDFVLPHVSTSFGIRSDDGAALLIDCGDPDVVDAVGKWLDEGVIMSLEGCWITHYHDDHVDQLENLRERFDTPMMTVEHMAEVIEHPERFFLPCISPVAVPVERKRDGESWQWHEYTLTAFHFPGQTFYHSGLLVEGHGTSVFFAGDSGSPTGIDDHCCPNRNFLANGRGFRRCIEIWREHKPEFIFNEHQTLAFSFTDSDLDYMDDMLARRAELFRDVLPWPDHNFGTDESWTRCYPYEQDTSPGSVFEVDVQFTNHADRPIDGEIEPVLPGGWTWDAVDGSSVKVPAETFGTVDSYVTNSDLAVKTRICVPSDATPGKYVIPFRITWDERYLGQFRHAIVNVVG